MRIKRKKGASLAANMLQMGQIYGTSSPASSIAGNPPHMQNPSFYDTNTVPGPGGVQTRNVLLNYIFSN